MIFSVGERRQEVHRRARERLELEHLRSRVATHIKGVPPLTRIWVALKMPLIQEAYQDSRRPDMDQKPQARAMVFQRAADARHE